eukprot:12280007-Alexandrium_andersonii.AAC.1
MALRGYMHTDAAQAALQGLQDAFGRAPAVPRLRAAAQVIMDDLGRAVNCADRHAARQRAERQAEQQC